MSTPVLDHVLHGKNGSSRPVLHDATIRSFAADETSVLGMLIPSTRDLVAMHWSQVNSLLFVPDLFQVQNIKNRALFRRGRTLWDQMALDDMIASALRAWVGFLIQDVRVIPANDTAEGKFVADAITAMLRAMPGGTLGTINELVTSGAKHGFSVSECDYAVASSGVAQGWFALTNIRTQLPHYIVPVHDPEGRLECIQQIDPYSHSERRTLDMDKCLHWVINADVDSFAGGSILAPAHPAWVAKNLFQQLRNEAGEWATGRLEVDHTDEEGRILSEAQFNVRAKELIANYLRFRGYKVWRGMAVKLVQSSTGPDLFNAVIRELDKDLCRAVGPPWLSLEEGQFGTRAQAEVHASVFETTVRPIREYSAEVLREGPIRQVCEMNGWPLRHRPDITLERAAEADQQKVIAAFLSAVNAGIVKPQPSDADEIRGRLGWPLTAPPEPGAEEQEAAQAVSLNGAQISSAVAIISQITQAGLSPDAAKAMLTTFLPISPEAAEGIIGPLRTARIAAPPAPTPPVLASAPDQEFSAMGDDVEMSAMGDLYRAIVSKHPDWSREQVIAVMLSKARRAGLMSQEFAQEPKRPPALEEKAQPALDKAWNQATKEMAKKALAMVKNGMLSPIALLREIKAIDLDLEPLRVELEDAIVGAWHAGQKQATKEVNQKKLSFGDQTIPEPATLGDFKKLLKSRSFRAVGELRQQAFDQIAKQLEEIYSSGITHDEAQLKAERLFMDMIEEGSIVPGTPGHDVTLGNIRSTVLRTNQATAFQEARMDVYERSGGYVKGVQIDEVGAGLEENSHPLSAVTHGLKIRLDDPRLPYLQPPNAFNDRAVSIPLIAEDTEAAGFQWSTDAELDHAMAVGRATSPRFF